MIKKVLFLFCAVLLASVTLFYSSPQAQPSNTTKKTNSQLSAPLAPQLEFFAGVGYFHPSLKQWNDAIQKVNAEILANGAGNFQAFQQVKDGVVSDIEPGLVNFNTYAAQSATSQLEANPINHLGIRYYFSEKISLALSIAYLKNETSTSYSAAAQGTEIQWPHYGYSISDYLTISQEINSYPTLLTLYYQPPARLLGDRIHFYVGGGVGLYFSTLSTDISRNYTMDHSKGKANWPQVDISGDPLVADILSNIRAKANPFGYHVAAGLNVSYKNIFINIEFGYHLATAKFGEEDWTYFTRSFTQIKNFEGKNFNSASGQYETIYQETKKYFLEIPESAYDNLKMTKLDFSGILIKGGIGFSF